MFQSVLSKVFGSKNDREVKLLWPLVRKVSELEEQMKKLSNEELARLTQEFKNRLDRGESLDSILPEAFAVVREASIRVLGMRHFDVQIIGGVVLHQGRIAEMKTGEGKTLCATLPVYLNALSGKGVHLVTVNDYLAKRDAEWMGAIYSFLGLTTGVVVNSMGHVERKAAYAADVTYGQNNEFGFDYLRDNMKRELDEMVQRPHNFAIVDEVDSILVDEARTPLIISGPSEKPTELYHVADKLVKHLKEEEHFTIDLKSKQVVLTDDGVKKVEQLSEIDNLYDPENVEIVHHMNQALKAHVTMHKDVDYVVRGGEVLIVDEFTGRLMSGRRWGDGLHQAVEAKERVSIQQENQTLATITFQNYFRKYEKLAGMTGTADTEAVEFKKIYNLDVVVVPTNKPMVRDDSPDVVFSNEKGKIKAVCEEIAECVEQGQPVLVGTASIAKSEELSAILSSNKVKHHVLNAKQHQEEAGIVAQAGRLEAVTISTNMAGRGTDIVLGGNPEFLLEEEIGDAEVDEDVYQERLDYFTKACAQEREKVLAAGGLHVLATERHESRRIDNQLRGRSGRQGDPGSSRFYVSLEDDLMKRFGGERMQAIMTRVGMQEDDAIEGTIVARAIENAQKKVEGHHFDIRKHLLEYDDVMTKQRDVIYAKRVKILRGDGVEEEILSAMPDVIEDLVLVRADEKKHASEWDIAGMFDAYAAIFGEELKERDEFIERQENADKGGFAQEIFELMCELATKRYEIRKERFGAEHLVKQERYIFLHSIDYFWKEHLAAMDHLKEGINLRGYAQVNPLHEYQREAYSLFTSMMDAINTTVLQNIMIPELPSEEEIRELERRDLEYQRQLEAAAATVHEDVTEGGGETLGETVDKSGLNRRQRRRKEALEKVTAYTPSESDYRPTEASVQQGQNAAKLAKRKKAKMAKKSRKKARR